MVPNRVARYQQAGHGLGRIQDAAAADPDDHVDRTRTGAAHPAPRSRPSHDPIDDCRRRLARDALDSRLDPGRLETGAQPSPIRVRNPGFPQDDEGTLTERSNHARELGDPAWPEQDPRKTGDREGRPCQRRRFGPRRLGGLRTGVHDQTLASSTG